MTKHTMTRDEILNMPAGNKIDAWIDVLIFGDDGTNYSGKHYSTDISAAWEVVEKTNSFEVELIIEKDGMYECQIWNGDTFHPEQCIRADTMPLAICRAALLTILEDE